MDKNKNVLMFMIGVMSNNLSLFVDLIKNEFVECGYNFHDNKLIFSFGEIHFNFYNFDLNLDDALITNPLVLEKNQHCVYDTKNNHIKYIFKNEIKESLENLLNMGVLNPNFEYGEPYNQVTFFVSNEQKSILMSKIDNIMLNNEKKTFKENEIEIECGLIKLIVK